MRYSINLLIVATNKYTQFLEPLLDSAFEYFLRGHDVNFCIFTDKKWEVIGMFSKKRYKVHVFEVEHHPWPHSTLFRFHFFKQYKGSLSLLKANYYFYVDVDCLFTAPIGDEILGERVAVSHCGYLQERGTYETRPESTAFIGPNEGEQYFGGGFWGFSSAEFWKAVEHLTKAIDKDEENGITAIFHDESHANRYFVDNPPTVILSPSYHFPQNHNHIYSKWRKLGVDFQCKILLLQKNHKEIRK